MTTYKSFTVFFLYLLIGLLSSRAIANQPLMPTSYKNLKKLDTRDTYNFYSIYLEIDKQEIVLFEQVEDINFDKIRVNLALLSSKANNSDQTLKLNGIYLKDNYLTLVGYEYKKGQPWLYVSVSDGYENEARIIKGRLSLDGNLTDLVELKLDDKLMGGSWPRYKKLDENHSVISYRNVKCCNLELARSTDGIEFDIDDSFKQSGAMPIVGRFYNEGLIYNYQRSFPTSEKSSAGKTKYVQKSRFRLSDSEGSWKSERLVSEAVFEVHDAFPFTRIDGNIDIYYSHDFGRSAGQLSLWRRCVNSDGELGKEELVVGSEVGNIAKPYVYRKSNDAIALLFIEQGDSLKKGAIQYYATLEHDATCDI